MGNLYSMLKQQEGILDEPISVGVRWAVGERIRALNESSVELNRELHILDDIASFSTVAYQRDYNIPRTQDSYAPVMEDVTRVVFEPGTTQITLERTTLKDMVGHKAEYGQPRAYTEFNREGVIKLDPIPSAAAASTTINGAINASVATITLTSVTGLPTEGRGKIDNEVISWNYVDTTLLQLQGVTRGVEGTTAAAHSSLATFTWRNVMVYYIRRPDPLIRAYYTGTATTTNASTTVSLATGVTTNTVLAGDYFGTGIKTPADPERYYKIASITNASTLALAEAWNEASASSVAYGIGQPSPFPDAYDDALVYLSCMKLLAKDDDPKVVMCKTLYEDAVRKYKEDGVPDDYLIISGKRRIGRQGFLDGKLTSGSWDGF